MRILEIVNDPAFAEIVSPSELAWLEARINDSKPGKPTIPCIARGKDVPAKKEEIVRQLWLRRLTVAGLHPSRRAMLGKSAGAPELRCLSDWMSVSISDRVAGGRRLPSTVVDMNFSKKVGISAARATTARCS